MLMDLNIRIFETTPGKGDWTWCLSGNDGTVRITGSGCILLEDGTEEYSPEAALANAFEYMCKILAKTLDTK